jgi:hypothetical protein
LARFFTKKTETPQVIGLGKIGCWLGRIAEKHHEIGVLITLNAIFCLNQSFVGFAN